MTQTARSTDGHTGADDCPCRFCRTFDRLYKAIQTEMGLTDGAEITGDDLNTLTQVLIMTLANVLATGQGLISVDAVCADIKQQAARRTRRTQ